MAWKTGAERRLIYASPGACMVHKAGTGLVQGWYRAAYWKGADQKNAIVLNAAGKKDIKLAEKRIKSVPRIKQ